MKFVTRSEKEKKFKDFQSNTVRNLGTNTVRNLGTNTVRNLGTNKLGNTKLCHDYNDKIQSKNNSTNNAILYRKDYISPSTVNISTDGEFFQTNRNVLESIGVDVNKIKDFLSSIKGSDYSEIMRKGSKYTFSIRNSQNHSLGNNFHKTNNNLKSIHQQKIELKTNNNLRSIHQQKIAPKSNINPNAKDNKDCYYDYIVVGSGPSGCVIAYNLMKAGFTVLLLEAGDDNSSDDDIRQALFGREYNVSYTWHGETLPQPRGGSVYQWKNGRTKGGGSSINGMQCVDSIGANAPYWDELAIKLGDTKWNSVNMINIRKKIENYIPYEFAPDSSRGTNGPLVITSYPDDTSLYTDSTVLSNLFSVYFGVPAVDDYNLKTSPISCSFSRWQITVSPTNDETLFNRNSADTAFIDPYIDNNGYGKGIAKDKLRLIVNATVTNINICRENKKVNGLIYTRYGKNIFVEANKEVILCTNLNTTQLLQHNGIGPASVLNAANEPVLVDSPHVGRHLKNHTGVLMSWIDITGQLNGESLRYTGLNGGAFMEYPAFLPGGKRAIQWIFLTYPTGPPGSPVLILVLALPTDPYSDGSVEIQNQDPHKIVAADPNYYNDNNGTNVFPPPLRGASVIDNYGSSIDFALSFQACQDIRDFMLTQGFFPISPSLSDYDDPEIFRSLPVDVNIQAHHWANENRMGLNINDGVCDSTGRVFGVKGLRLAGATILPEAQGNMQMPSYLCGQKIAEDILAGN
jgi:choline dehydrogenase